MIFPTNSKRRLRQAVCHGQFVPRWMAFRQILLHEQRILLRNQPSFTSSLFGQTKMFLAVTVTAT